MEEGKKEKGIRKIDVHVRLCYFLDLCLRDLGGEGGYRGLGAGEERVGDRCYLGYSFIFFFLGGDGWNEEGWKGLNEDWIVFALMSKYHKTFINQDLGKSIEGVSSG